MDDDEVDAGHFEPIAQMRRLAIVLPKVLEPVDKIPVKLCLPAHLDPDLFSDLLNEQVDSISKHESVKKEKDLSEKVAVDNCDEHKKEEWEESEREGRKTEKNEINRKENERTESEQIQQEKNIVREKKVSERKEVEKTESERKELPKKEEKHTARENKESINKGLEYKEQEKNSREKELEKREREKNVTETTEHENMETDSNDYERRDHKRKGNFPKIRKDHILPKEISGKQNYWSESETSSVRSVASRLSLQPGRNMRATPLSRASSRNTNYDDPHTDIDRIKTSSRRAEKVSRMEDRDHSYWNAQKRVKDKDRDLVDQMVEGRRREHRKEVNRYYVRSMINDTYGRKRNGIASSSDLDHPSASRGLPTGLRSHSTLSHHNSHSSHAHNEPKHHHHHRSKRSDTASHHHGNSDVGRRSADWVRSQQVGRRVQSAEPLNSVKGSDEVENVIMIIKEEFKRLGFL